MNITIVASRALRGLGTRNEGPFVSRAKAKRALGTRMEYNQNSLVKCNSLTL